MKNVTYVFMLFFILNSYLAFSNDLDLIDLDVNKNKIDYSEKKGNKEWPKYKVIDLGKDLLSPPWRPLKINNNGIVAGTRWFVTNHVGGNSQYKEEAFFYDSKNEKHIYIDSLDNEITRILDLNNKDEIVGIYSVDKYCPNSGRSTYHVPFTYSQNKGFSSLGSTLIQIDGINLFSTHIEINDFGALAGYGIVDSIFDFFSHKGSYRYGNSSFILTGKTAVVLNHPTYPTSFGVNVKSLNNSGDVAGGIFYGGGQNSQIYRPAYAFMQDHIQKKIIILGNLGGKDKFYSCATCLNNSKQIVGLSEVNVKGKHNKYNYHAFLWENGSLFDLGTLEEDQDSMANSINNQGDIIGISGERCIGNTYNASWHHDSFKRAFLWTEQNGMVDLNQLIDKDLNLFLLEAIDINDNGQIICLAKNIINNNYQIVLLNPE